MERASLLVRLIIAAAPAVVACGASTEPSDPGGGGSGGAGGASCAKTLPPNTATAFYCHTLADCPGKSGSDVCTAEQSDVQGCGNELPRCKSDADCNPTNAQPPTSLCHARTGYSTCGPSCVMTPTICEASAQCNQATGHCDPIACGDAKPCPEGSYCAGDACKMKQCDPAQQGACGSVNVCDPKTFSCVARPCTGKADCPDFYVCNGGACAQQACSCDAECGEGYCQRGICTKEPGRCQSLAVCGRPLRIEGAPVLAPLSPSSAWG